MTASPGSLLSDFMLSRAAAPFAWGRRDCAMLAFDAVRVATGRDPAADLRGAYASALQARRVLKRLGGWAALAAARFGAPVAPACAVDGDVALLDPAVCSGTMAAGGALAVRWRGRWVAQGAHGLVWVDDAAARQAWRAA